MPLFIPPLASSTTTRYSQASSLRSRISAATPRKKRKHHFDSGSSSVSSASSDDGRPDAATNPLSLTPDESAQYKLAGLNLGRSLPSVHVSAWPHTGLPAVLPLDKNTRRKLKKEKGKQRAFSAEAEDEAAECVAEDESKGEEQSGGETAPRLRLKHFSVLTTILHRCLLEGDIKRAGRAWALIIRMQTGGKGIDVRSTGYWGIGAELLIRSLDCHMKPKSSRKPLTYDSGSDSEADIIHVRDEALDEATANRWGTAEGLLMAKDYYERLIIEHPFKRAFATSVSALEFWPCMIGCEIYGIQYEQRASLRKLELQNQDSNSLSPSSEPESEDNNEGLDSYASEARESEKKRRKREERTYLEKELVREIALAAATLVTTRLDDRMTVPPFSDSSDLLRLRGMLALYVGDLSVPEKPVEEEEDAEVANRASRSGRARDRPTERRFLFRERLMNWERGVDVREEMAGKAKLFFTKIRRNGGDVSDIPAEYFEVGKEAVGK